MGLEDDILPDTNTERDRTTAGKFALGVLVVVIVLITLSFVTVNWLEGDPRFYGTEFESLGLWVHCFRSYPDYNDLKHQQYYAGCRWIFNPFTAGYDKIRTYLVPPFFVAVQFFFTLCFIGVLLASVMVLSYLLCIEDYYRVKVLRWTGFTLVTSAFCGSIALLIFGTRADGEDFMPDAEHNYLSWSFGLAFVGVFFEFVAAILFIVEARILQRKEIAKDMKDQELNMRSI